MTTLLHRTLTLLRSGTAALAGLAFLLAAPASAQIVFDDFNDDDYANVSAFAGNPAGDAGAGVGPTDGTTGEGTGLNLGVNPGTTSDTDRAFAGFAVEAPGSGIDATGAEYFTFSIRTSLNASNTPIVLEVNLQEDADGDGTYEPATEDEYQATILLDAVGGQPYTFVQLPISAFTDDNSFNVGANDGFDFSRVKFVVMAMGNLGGEEFAISFDEFTFYQNPVEDAVTTAIFDDFNDDDYANVSAFAGNPAGDAGAGVGPTDGTTGEGTGLNLGVNPGTTSDTDRAFAGFAVEAPGSGIDATGAEYFTFSIRTSLNASNTPIVLEVNLQEDADGDGTYEPATEDEYQATILLDAVGGQPYTFVQLPISAFTDDNSFNVGANDGFDFSRVKFVVMAMGNLGGEEFAISFDEFAFAEAADVAVGGLPDAFTTAPVTFPNPTAGSATIAFELANASTVSVDVVDLLGRRVAQLADGPRAAGEVRLAVPTATFAPGVYVVRVLTEAGMASTRLTVVR